MMLRAYLLTIPLLFVMATTSISQVTLKGQITDQNSGEDLIGASIIIKDQLVGTISDIDGSFQLEVPALPITLVFSYTGYAEVEREITDGSKSIRVKMSTAAIITDVVEVKGQRIDEKKKSSALTVESLDPIAIKQTASENFYDGLGALKGVDLTSASLGIKVVNTRGFNSTAPVRILQTIDGGRQCLS